MRNPIHMILERMTLWISVEWLAIQSVSFYTACQRAELKNSLILFYCVSTQFSPVDLKLPQQTV